MDEFLHVATFRRSAASCGATCVPGPKVLPEPTDAKKHHGEVLDEVVDVVANRVFD
jgi:hypothetical protein